jgi:hypothetical protein
MRKGIGGIALAVGIILATGVVRAETLFENWNTAACGFTNKASFALEAPTYLKAVEVWYHWEPGEETVPYVLLQSGNIVKKGRLTRTDCDPYQQAWCNARGNVGAELPPGRVTIKVERSGICQNSGSEGQGFVRAIGSQE